MDDFLKRKDSDNGTNDPAVKKKIEFKIIKEKRSNITYVFNIEQYITDPAKVKDAMSDMKKAFGTFHVKKELEFGTGHGFSGDFKDQIKTYLIKHKYVTVEDFA